MIFKILTGRLICQVVPMFAFPSQQRRAPRSKVHSKYSQLIGDDSQKNFVSMLVVCLDYLYHEMLVNEVMTLVSSAWQNKAINKEALDDRTSQQRWRWEGGRWEVPTEVAALHFSRWASKSGQTGPDWTAFLGPIHSHLHFCPHLQPLVLSAYMLELEHEESI